jgi:hypothetical protein
VGETSSKSGAWDPQWSHDYYLDMLHQAARGLERNPPEDPPKAPRLRFPRLPITFRRHSGSKLKANSDAHDEVAKGVFRRLQLRDAQLSALEDLARMNKLHLDLYERREPSGPSHAGHRSPSLPVIASEEGYSSVVDQVRGAAIAADFASFRAYHLAVTDLFVEKAIVYLEEEARTYRTIGIWANVGALAVFAIGGGAALYKVFVPSPVGTDWTQILSSFLTSFTAYGLIVLLGVGMRRYGRAMADQGERLFERRHAMRQGRLFVHLNDGILTIGEMEKAFNWNAAGANAFSNMQTEDQAPVGAAVKELARQVPDLVRAGVSRAVRSIDEDVPSERSSKHRKS